MSQLVLRSYFILLRIELLIRFRSLSSIHALVRNSKIKDNPGGRPHTPEDLCEALNLACVFYPKQVLCLQRSAATVLLLRRYGLKAQMVIGAQMLPFRSHAWVEIDGVVVNDKPYMLDIYLPLDRC